MPAAITGVPGSRPLAIPGAGLPIFMITDDYMQRSIRGKSPTIMAAVPVGMACRIRNARDSGERAGGHDHGSHVGGGWQNKSPDLDHQARRLLIEQTAEL
jgi:hypothetical protein